MGKEEFFCFGVVIGTHGLRGDLKIRPLTGDSSALEGAQTILFRRPDGTVAEYPPVRVAIHKGNLLVRLQGFENVEATAPLVGSEVLMRFDDLTDLPEDEFYWFELQGMTVVDAKLGELGVLEDLFTTAAHDIYVVRGRFGEVLIPAVGEIVTEIDRDGNRILVDLPKGLVAEPE